MPDLNPASATGATVPSTSTDASSAAQPSTTTQPGSPSQLPGSTAAPALPGAAPASAIARPADTWVAPPRERWVENERARRDTLARAERLDAELAQERRRVQALAGVNPQKPEEAQKQQVADAFFELFPQFAMFKDPKVAEKLSTMLAKGDELSQATDHVWDGLTRRTLDSIAKSFAEETGVDPSTLDTRARRELASLFFQMAADNPEEFRKRYEREDPKLVEEFMGQMKTRYFDPVRRREASGFVRGQVRVPSSGPGRPVVSAPPNIDFGNREAVEDAAVQYLRDRGHLQGA
jgi:hypothetical protein